MRKIPLNLRDEILKDPFYQKCARHSEGTCKGRITWEHAIIYAGRQVNKKWAIIPLCTFHHAVDEFQDRGDLDKEKNVWIALNRANLADLDGLSKAVNYNLKKANLNRKYGKYEFNN